jgi:hypothetical protein
VIDGAMEIGTRAWEGSRQRPIWPVCGTHGSGACRRASAARGPGLDASRETVGRKGDARFLHYRSSTR